METHELLYSTAALVALTNPVAEIVPFLTIVEGRSLAERRMAALRVAVGVLLVLGVATIVGRSALTAMGIGMPAFRVAGGLLLVVMGLEMAQGREPALQTADPAHPGGDDRLWVPLVMPMLAGPGAIVTAVSLSLRETAHRTVPLATLGAVVISALVVLVVLLLAGVLGSRISARKLRILTGFSGIFLISIGCQMGFTGIAEFFSSTSVPIGSD